MILALAFLAIVALCGICWYLTRPPAPHVLIEHQLIDAQRQHVKELQLAEEYEMQAAVHRVRAASYERRVKRLSELIVPRVAPPPKGAADQLAKRLESEALAELHKHRSSTFEAVGQELHDAGTSPTLAVESAWQELRPTGISARKWSERRPDGWKPGDLFMPQPSPSSFGR